MVDITRTSVLRHEAEKALRRLPSKASKRIQELLAITGTINDDTILEAQHIITQELGAKEAHKVLNRYSMLFWKRGSDFALRQLKHTELIFKSAVSASVTTGAAIRRLKHVGLTLEVPSYLAVTDAENLNALRAMQFDLVKGMGNDMKKDVAFQMREGLLRGEHPIKIANRITEVARITKNKATRIARTEATRVFNEAAGDRYTKAGVEKFRWDAIMDERTSDICKDLNGKIFKMDATKPPAHPGCRCTITPVIEKPKEIEEKVITPKEPKVKKTSIPETTKEKRITIKTAHEDIKKDLNLHSVNAYDSPLGKVKLSKREFEAASRYKSAEFTKINGSLRGRIKPPMKGLKTLVKDIDSGMAKSAMPKDVQVYRGISPRVSEQIMKTNMCENAGYTSTTFKPDYAFSFADRGKDGFMNVMQFEAKKGTKALMWPGYESEILLQRGLKLKCTGIKEVTTFVTKTDKAKGIIRKKVRTFIMEMV